MAAAGGDVSADLKGAMTGFFALVIFSIPRCFAAMLFLTFALPHIDRPFKGPSILPSLAVEAATLMAALALFAATVTGMHVGYAHASHPLRCKVFPSTGWTACFVLDFIAHGCAIIALFELLASGRETGLGAFVLFVLLGAWAIQTRALAAIWRNAKRQQARYGENVRRRLPSFGRPPRDVHDAAASSTP